MRQETRATPDPPNDLLVRRPRNDTPGYAAEMLEENAHCNKLIQLAKATSPVKIDVRLRIPITFVMLD